MRKVSEESKKNNVSATKPKDRANTSRRKNKGQDEEKSESTGCDVRSGKSQEEVLTIKKTRKKKIIEPEGLRTFDATTLRSGDKFTFLSPGKGKKSYVCTVLGSDVLFERDDKHTYTRHLSEISEIVKSYHLVCTLIQ